MDMGLGWGKQRQQQQGMHTRRRRDIITAHHEACMCKRIVLDILAAKLLAALLAHCSISIKAYNIARPAESDTEPRQAPRALDSNVPTPLC